MLTIQTLNELMQIRGAKNKKLHLSSLHDIHGNKIKDLLGAAYDPFLRFGSVNNARVYLVSLALPPEFAERVFKKDLRIGMAAKSINSIWPGLIPTHDVMLAKSIEWDRVKYPCWSTVKLDGVRAIFREGEFYFRNGKRIHGLQHLTKQLGDCQILDGELLCPELNFQQSSGQIRSYDASPTAEFHIIDLPDAESPVFKLRMLLAHQLIQGIARARVVRHHLAHEERHLREEYSIAIIEGYEGVVVKPTDYSYVGKRSYDWMKIKAIETEDLYVADIFEGTGKYANMLGGVIVNRGGVEVRVGSGFTDAQRAIYWDSTNLIINRLIEVQYHEVTPAGSLRHPRFIRFRDDKDME